MEEKLEAKKFDETFFKNVDSKVRYLWKDLQT